MQRMRNLFLALIVFFSGLLLTTAQDIQASPVIEDGNYTIEATALKADSDQTSIANNFMLHPSQLIVKDGEIKLTVTFTNSEKIKNMTAKVNEQAVVIEEVVTEANERIITIPLTSLNDAISVNADINPFLNVIINSDFRLVLDENTLVKEGEEGNPSEPSTPDNEGNVPESGEPEAPEESTPGDKEETPDEEQALLLADGIYYIENRTLHATKDEESLARNFLEKQSLVEVVDGKAEVVITFTNKDAMSNPSVKINEKVVDIKATETKEGGLEVRFPIQSFKDNMVVSAKILGSMSVEFRLFFDENTLTKKDESTEVPQPPVVTPPTVDEEEIPTQPEDSEQTTVTLKDGTYQIKNVALHETKDEDSIARQYLNEMSTLTVKNGLATLTLTFLNGDLMSNHQIKINGKNVKFEVKESNGTQQLMIPINRLSDELLINVTVMGMMNVNFRVRLLEDTLEKGNATVVVKPTTPSTGIGTTNKPTTVTPVISAPTQETTGKVYQINNSVYSASTIGYQAARQSLSTLSYLEETEKGMYLTLGFSQMDLMSNLRFYINGKLISHSVTQQNTSAGTIQVRFPISSVSSTITVKAYVSAIGRDISFTVSLLENTMKLISQSDLNQTLPVSKVEEGTVEEELIEEEVVEVPQLTGKLIRIYEIQNEALSDSTIGKSMARKYLVNPSIIEEVDGELYVTVTFTGADSMANFRFEVNGVEVEHYLILDDEEKAIKQFKFKINDVTDQIQVYLFVTSVKMNIDFGVQLLEETQTLISEQVLGENEDISSVASDASLSLAENYEVEESNTLKYIIGAVAIISVLVVAGIVVKVKRNKKKITEEE